MEGLKISEINKAIQRMNSQFSISDVDFLSNVAYSIIMSITNSKDLVNESKDEFIYSIAQNKYTEIRAILGIVVPESYFSLNTPVHIDRQMIDESVNQFISTTINLMSQMYVNWSEVVPVFDSENNKNIPGRTKIVLSRMISSKLNDRSKLNAKRKKVCLNNVAIARSKSKNQINLSNNQVYDYDCIEKTINNDDTGSFIHIYGLNWIFQLQCFHKLIFNDVLIATGQPGAGKSTELPKLIYHFMSTNCT